MAAWVIGTSAHMLWCDCRRLLRRRPTLCLKRGPRTLVRSFVTTAARISSNSNSLTCREDSLCCKVGRGACV